jgi:hypothetical protein
MAAIAILGVVASAGLWLGGLYLLAERPPGRLKWPGLLHGLGGLAGFAVLVASVPGSRATPHAVRMGAGSFAVVAELLLAAALVAGAVILAVHLRRRPVSASLVAVHGMLAITGYTLLVTYLTMLY